MRRLKILLLCNFLFTSAFAQKSVVGSQGTFEYVFKAKSDSLLWLRLDSLKVGMAVSIRDANDPIQVQRYDSLMKIRFGLAQNAIGRRYIYKPRFRIWEDLDSTEREDITQLTLYNWKSDRLPNELLQCKSLEKLEIINSGISLVQKEINALPKLQTIEFYNNNPVRPLRFEKNTTVTTLLIRANSPAKLPKKFRKLKSLERLDLSRTKLESIPRVYGNKNLKVLILTDNSIQRIQLNWFRKQKSLERVDIRINKIKAVPFTIKNWPALKVLDLNVNEISKVSSTIGKLHRLEALSFYHNNLTSIPRGVYRLKSLRKLDLYYNRIERLENDALQWKEMNVLGLDNNLITYLTPNIGDMPKLTEIYLNNNRLSSLPESFQKLTNMTALQIKSNYLTEFPAPILKLTNLSDLDISGNKIASVPGELFDFKKFEYLSLYGNPWNTEALKKLPAWVEKLRSEKTFVAIEPPVE